MEQWKLINTIPRFKFVLGYCKEAFETKGAASETKGTMIICCVNTDEFIDNLGNRLNWRFTNWQELPDKPKELCIEHDLKLNPIAGNGLFCTKCGFITLIGE